MGRCTRLFYPPYRMLDAQLYIACLDLTDRRVIVVGAGPMADEKAEGLRSCGAKVEHILPVDYTPDVLEGAFLVMVATEDEDFNRTVFRAAEERSMFVNVADVPEMCNLILPAITRDGPLAVAISTSGASPALAKRMKREAAEMFDHAYSQLAAILDDVRPWAKEHLPDYEARRDFFDSIVNGDPDPIDLLRRGRIADVKTLIERAQEQR
ncbi:MAG: precorrin-2 dehydrogenase [Actinomycetota bacterium]|nr:precorrin-2 dehydrogenase [Actinomycetota bacterium]